MVTLVVEISKEGDRLKMGAFERSKGLDVTLKHYNDCYVSDEKIENLCGEITYLFNKANRQGKVGENFASDLKKICRTLFDQLLTFEVKKAIKNTEAKFLLISIDEKLVQIPWELLHDGDEFLCIRFAMGRSVKTKQKNYGSRYRSVSSPTKMLIVANPTGDLNSAYEEGIYIRNELDKRKGKVRVFSKTEDVSIDFVRKNIRDYDIFHFAGHAEYNSINPSESGWILKDGKFTAKEIVELGATSPLPSIIFSNACQSGKTTEWKVGKEFEDEIYGLANAFLLAGIRHYIGTFWRVLDEPCLCFANEFYKNVTDGLPIGEAIRLSRIQLINKYGYSSIVWSSYMLYGDPAINLFFVSTVKKPLKERIFQRQIIILSIILGSIIGTGLSGFLLYRNYFSRPIAQESPAWAHRNIVLIMPFENLNRDKETDWMGLGIANVVATKLNKLDKINVVDRFQAELIWKEIKKADYVDKESALKIAKILGADRIILGSFQKIDDDIRISAQLFNVKDDSLIGSVDASDSYSNFFSLEDTVALSIGDKLNIKISKRERSELSKFLPTENISAFEFLTKSISAFTERDINKAVDFCKKALELDPNYIQANTNMGLLYDSLGNLDLAKVYYEEALELTKKSEDKNLFVTAYFNLGKLLGRTGQWKEGMELQRKALKIAGNLSNQQVYASILYNIGLSYIANNEFNEAKKSLFESKAIYETLNNQFGLAAIHLGLGIYYSYNQEADFDKAEKYYDEAIRISENLNSKEGLAKIYSILGGHYHTRGEWEKGSIYFVKSLKVSQEINDSWSENLAYCGLAKSYEEKGEFGNALEYYKKSLKLTEEAGNRTGHKNTLYSISSLYLRQLRNDMGLKYLNMLVEEAKKDKDERNQILGLRWIASTYYSMGRYEKAMEGYNKALTFNEALNSDRNSLMQIYLGLGKCVGQLGNNTESEKYFELAKKEVLGVKEYITLGYIYQQIGTFYENKGRMDRAIRNYMKASESLTKDKLNNYSKFQLVGIYFGLAECYKKQNNKAKAFQYYKKALPFAEETSSPIINTIKSNLYFIDKGKEEQADEIKNIEAKKLYIQARNNFFNGEHDKALVAIKKAYKKEPFSSNIVSLICLTYEDMGRYDEATDIHLKYIKLLDKKEDISEIIAQYSWIGGNYRKIGKLDKAKTYYDKALGLAKNAGSKEDIGLVYADYGMVMEALGQDERAIEFANKAIEFYKGASKVNYLTNAYHVLSLVYSKQGDTNKALEYAHLNLKIKEESGSGDMERSYINLGSLYKDIDIVKSLEYLNKAISSLEKKGQLSLLGNAYHETGSVYEGMKQSNKALEFYNKSLALSDKLNDAWTTYANYLALEHLYFKTKEYKLSEEFREKLINLAKELGREIDLGIIYGAIGDRYIDEDFDKGEKYFLMSIEILEGYKNNEYKNKEILKTLAIDYDTLGMLFGKRKNWDKAIMNFQKAIDIAESHNVLDKSLLGNTYYWFGVCYHYKNDFKKALEYYRKARPALLAAEEGRSLIKKLDNQINILETYLSLAGEVQDFDGILKAAEDYHREDKWELALENYKKALAIAVTLKDGALKDSVNKKIEWIHKQINRIETYFKEVEVSKKAKPAGYLESKAILYMRQGKYNVALDNFKKALKIYESVDYKEQMNLSKMRIGFVYLTKNDFKNAEKLFKESMNTFKDLEDKEYIGLVHGAFGILFEKKGKYNQSEKEYHIAIDLLKESESSKTYDVAYYNCLGSVYYKKQNYNKSLESYQMALELGKEIEDPNSISLTYAMMAYVSFLNGSFEKANNFADNSLVVAERLDDMELICIASLVKGKAFMRQSDYEMATQFFDKAINSANSCNKNKLKLVSYSNMALLAKKEKDGNSYKKLLSFIKEMGSFDCIKGDEILDNRLEILFKEIIEEKDFFKRIWL